MSMPGMETSSGRSLEGRVAVITGAARGVGLATVRLMLERGAEVIAVDRDGASLKSALESLPALAHSLTGMTVDVCDPQAGTLVLDAALANHDRVDILVNNAGGSGGTPMAELWETDLEDWETVIRLNLTSVYGMCHEIVPTMVRRGYGRVVNVASMAGKDGVAKASSYSAAKAGVIGLTKTLGKELARTGVLVNAIAPAVIETDAIRAEGYDPDVRKHLISLIPMGRMAQPEEVAELIGFLASDAVTFSTGAVYDISGGRATY